MAKQAAPRTDQHDIIPSRFAEPGEPASHGQRLDDAAQKIVAAIKQA